MGLTGERIPGDAPLDEGYWQALLTDEEYGETSLAAGQSPGGQGLYAPAGSQAQDNWQAACRAMESGEGLERPARVRARFAPAGAFALSERG
jgi:hypothetical protein